MISKDLLPDNGVYINSFTLPERIRYPARSSRDGVGAGLPSQAPTLLTLCLSIGTWTIEASYQTAPKQKFKTGFEVKEYGEKGVPGRTRWVPARSGAGNARKVSWCMFHVPGPELGAGEQDRVSSPPELPESSRKEQVGQGRDGSKAGTVKC